MSYVAGSWLPDEPRAAICSPATESSRLNTIG